MDNTFDIDEIDWENVGPSEQPTGCKGRRSDLFNDLRRPLTDLDGNLRRRNGGESRASSCTQPVGSGRCSSSRSNNSPVSPGGDKQPLRADRDAAPAKATARKRRCYKYRRQLDADNSRSELVVANMDRFPDDVPTGACGSPPTHYCEDVSSPRAESTVSGPLSLGEQPSRAADDDARSFASSRTDDALSKADDAASEANVGSTAQLKSFADSLSALGSCWTAAASVEPSKKRRCSGSGRRSSAHELPAWDLNLVDGVADDLLTLDDVPLGRRPRRSLRLRRKSLIGQTPSESQEDSLLSDLGCFPTISGLSSSGTSAIGTTIEEEEATEVDQQQPFSIGSSATVESGWLRSQMEPATSPLAKKHRVLPTVSHSSRITLPPEVGENGLHDLLETAFIISPENAEAVGARLDSIAEEESVEPPTCPLSTPADEVGEQDAAEPTEPSVPCRPRRRTAVQRTQQQQQPDQKRRRQLKFKQQQQATLEQLDSASAGAAVSADGEDDPVVDATLLGLYTNKPYLAPDRRRLETIYEQPGVWRGQEKLMSAAPTARLLKFEPVAVSKTKQRRQKALHLGWRRSAVPEAASHERLEQCLKDLDEALLSVYEGEDDRGSNSERNVTAAGAAAASNFEQLAAIRNLALH